jgi:hypothetical protein
LEVPPLTVVVLRSVATPKRTNFSARAGNPLWKTMWAMNGTTIWILATLGLFVGMLVLIELGRRLGQHRIARDLEGARAGLGAVEGAVFGLLGLLIAFTFQGAASRFDTRRALIVEEANAVSTAWARLDMLPVAAQLPLRALFRRYLDARLAVYQQIPDLAAVRAALEKSNGLQQEIWNAATTVCRTDEGRGVTLLVLPPLNAMFDITTTRTMALLHHPPLIIFGSLFALALGCSLLAGFGMSGGKTRSWAHMLGFAIIMAFAVYVILDLEFPRIGLIRVDAADRTLTSLRESMKQPQ